MKRLLRYSFALLFCAFPMLDLTAQSGSSLSQPLPYVSPTEGVITHRFVDEATMQRDLLQMLADFSTYMVNDWNPCQAPNSLGESCGFFKGENSGGSDERGVRPNADLSMICAFLVKYAKPAGVTLPQGVTWDQLQDMACQSLVFAYSTHKANRLKVCAGGHYWGSTSKRDAVWESSLWAMSVAYSAFFQWDTLSEVQKNYIRQLLKAECNYELERDIPTGYRGDTKAEENAWEVDVLAATLGLFPDDELASRWFACLREFAINSYSHPSDADNHTVIDPHYDQKTVADLFRGANLYDDYTLQNHNLFHTSYQNVVMQELGEAALALKLFQRDLHGKELWHTHSLMHHCQEVQDSVLNWLALADGELAMPNGNDWSLFLFDQITSYTTQACFQRDANALMLENMAYKYIKARQQTTSDGSWLLRADVGARRMGVQAHRVMMTWLMHHVLPTKRLKPTRWEDFNRRYSKARTLPCQQVLRASTDSRFTCFSWSEGLKSYTGYVAANSPDKNKIIVPFRAHNTGNFLGWYEVEGHGVNAVPVSQRTRMMGNSFVMNGELSVNDGTLNHRFTIYSTPGNAVIYLDHVKALDDVTIKEDKGGLMAISTDEFTNLSRTLYYSEHPLEDDKVPFRQQTLDGTEWKSFPAQWVNIDNAVGIAGRNPDKRMAFGDRANNNSIFTAKLYPLYAYGPRRVKSEETVDARNLVYYSGISAEETKRLDRNLVSLRGLLPEGWNGVVASDPDGSQYLLVSNFRGNDKALLRGVQVEGWAPVLPTVHTKVVDNSSYAEFTLKPNESEAHPITVWIRGGDVRATMVPAKSSQVLLTGLEDERISVRFYDAKRKKMRVKNIRIKKGKQLIVGN